jgi:ABC-2 type transport system ATP-binding protein
MGGDSRTGSRVEARSLTRHFGPHVGLEDVDLTIEPGQTFGLLGANGAGKTTFIRLATGYILPSSGEITIDGLSANTRAREIQARIGYVPETPRLYPELRVRGFLRFMAGVRGLSGPAARNAIASVITRFRLEEVAQRLIANLSKGYRQRLSLAQAFLHDPPLMIFDEPTSGLDPVQREEVRGVIESLRDERTVILCTHDLDEARSITSQVGVLQAGRLVACGASHELLGGSDPLARFRDLGSQPTSDARRAP